MIIDHLRNASRYYRLGPGIEAGLRYLATTDFAAKEPGKLDIGCQCYVIVQDYQTKPREEKRWEAHQNYIDIQFIANGSELIGYADIQTLQTVEDYDETKDIAWFTGQGSFVATRTGTFVILFPEDAHMPGVAATELSEVRKIVVKVPA